MNRKSLLILLVVFFIAVCAAIWFLFLRQTPAEQPGAGIPTDFNPFPVSTTTIGGTQPTGTTSTTVSVAPTGVPVLDTACAGANSIFEKNDCISTLAKIKNDSSLCTYITGSLAQGECMKVATSSQATPVPQQTYAAFINSYFSTQTPTKTTLPVPSSTSNLLFPKAASSTVTEASVRYGLSFGAPLAVYAASRYQTLPGASIKIYGSGFTKTDNVLNIGSQQTNVGSADGSTLDTVAPGSVGEYEIWVTNAKGSSKISSRPVKISVTNSPLPLPAIESASPSPVSIDGTVTLTGTGFGSSNNILTSMGTLQNVPSNGTTISFAISSLQFSSYSKDVPELKGKIVPVFVNVQTAGGSAEKIFKFDVQF